LARYTQRMNSTVILITGAARRVGAEIARTLHAAGANVALHYLCSHNEAEQLARTLNELRPGSAFTIAADLGDSLLLHALVDEVVKHFGRLDGLVNNASSFFATPIGSIDEAAWQALIDSNLKGPLFLAQAAAPHLARRDGAIVNITDIHTERPLKWYAVYTSAKAGMAAMTRALAIELAPQVRVNAVAPGAILWPEDDSFSTAERAAIVAHTPLQRMGSPEDIARTVKFLLFDAPFITGQIINVDGGRSIHI
jgi:pteridine reductase